MSESRASVDVQMLPASTARSLDSDTLQTLQVTVIRQTIGQVVGRFGILEPPFDRDGLHEEAFQQCSRVLDTSPYPPHAYCTEPVFHRLLADLIEGDYRRGRTAAVRAHTLGGMQISQLRRRSPIAKALQRLEGVDMDEVIVVASLSDTALSVMEALFA